MRFILQTKSDKPIYQQMYEQISAQIVNNELKADEMLPSIRAIAAELGISVITVKKAWEMLEANGFIYTIAAKGCYVKEQGCNAEEKRISISEANLLKNLPFYRELGVSADELIELIRKNY